MEEGTSKYKKNLRRKKRRLQYHNTFKSTEISIRPKSFFDRNKIKYYLATRYNTWIMGTMTGMGQVNGKHLTKNYRYNV